jgi:probable HAF family extracellular repeat protein
LALEPLEARCLLSYTITDLGTFGGTLSNGNAINNRGQVAGGADLVGGTVSHPFLWQAGVLHDLGTLGGSNNNGADSINDLGQVVGVSGGRPFLWSRASGLIDLGSTGWVANHINNRTEVVGELNTPPHAFLWKDGSYLDLGTLNGGTSTAVGINDRGWVVGQSWGRAFLWTAGTGMHDLGTLDGASGGTSGANAINDLGQIVGGSYSITFGTTHAAYFTRQGVTDLGTLGGFSEATALNDLGQVVGDSYGTFGHHAFLTDLAGGPMVDLNTLIPPDSGWTLFSAEGINDAGQIVGSGQLPGNNIIHAYLLTPEDNYVVALMPVAPESPKVAVEAANVAASPGAALTPSPSPPGDENAGGARALSEGEWIPRSVAVLAALAAPQPAAQGWNDPLTDLLAP